MIIEDLFQGKNPPTNEEVLAKLMESIVDEEMALSNLISSEADKINAFVGKGLDFPTSPTNQEIVSFNQSTHRVMESISMKEWLLLKKLETVLLLLEKFKLEHKHKDRSDSFRDGE
ncbi:hypothetical protein [Rossellomorea aquimaris]|uniref:hypothetical protein n=1 Tax=Rossellomorea aquimaris TaxID=189382 RepID=UPI003990B583